ncbi:hypothetical protein PM082_022398 [Marasmius tenuissimus]|nr:hypothetical protein PM082_022398 [Marasmius tenuissimus]
MEQELEHRTVNGIQVVQDLTENKRGMPVLLTEASVSPITKGISVVDSNKGGVLTKISVMGAILLVTVVGIKSWFYTYTMEDLDRQINYVEDVIEQNLSLERDLLGNSGWKFRERLDGYIDEQRAFGAPQSPQISTSTVWDPFILVSAPSSISSPPASASLVWL